MNIKGIDHLVITTENLDACRAFYEGLLGMTYREECGHRFFAAGSQKLNVHIGAGELSPAAKHAAAGCADFCLEAEGDIREIKRALEDAGGVIAEGIVEQHGARGLMDSIYLYDPDGSLVEIAVYRRP